MRIDRLYLRSFRNYEEAEILPHPGVNLIVGENAQGKTNLLEAVSYLSAGRSFRTRKESELIRFGADFAELTAEVFSFDREKTLRTVLFSGRKPRQLFLSGVKQKTFAGVAGQLTSVLFCPDDLTVLRSGASARRRLLDSALCQLRPGYDHALSEYTRLLEHKSRILKDRFDDPSLLELLPDFNEQLCRYGEVIIRTRAAYLEKLTDFSGEFHRDFSGGKEELRLEYQTVSSVTDPKADAQTVLSQLREHMESHRRAELESSQCLSGPHRDDFETYLDGLPLRSFGSQGQTRTAAISLKLAERELMRRDSGEEPVLLLDDVLSELDAARQDYVLNHLKSGQVFITCCEPDRVSEIGKSIRVRRGCIE